MKNILNDTIKELFEKCEKKNGKHPKRFNWDDFDSIEQYKIYLEKELNK